MLEYTLLPFQDSTRKDIIMHSELDFRPVQIIIGHVIYNSPYKYWPDEKDLSHLLICKFWRQYVFSRDAGTGQTSLNFPNPWSRGYLLKMLKTLLLTICLDWPELLSVVPCTCRFWSFYFCWHSMRLVSVLCVQCEK